MNRSIRILGLLLSSFTVATVALAQQNSGQSRSVHAALPMLQDDASHMPRLTRPVERRSAGKGCITQTCAEPPAAPQRPVRIVRYNAGCTGGETFLYRDYDGQIIRGSCATP
jgi:hypothetical protein